MPYHHIVATTDFSDAADRAVHVAKELAEKCGAKFTLLHVHEPSHYAERVLPSGNRDRVDVEAESRARLEECAARLHLPERTRLELDMDASPVEGILDFVDKSDADLVVIAAQGHSGLERLLIGSVTERVVRHSAVAVLAVKPPQDKFV